MLWREGNPPGSRKPFTAFLRAHTYRKGERREQTADPISLLSPEGVLAAGERKKYKLHKDAASQDESHAGFASTTNPRAKFNRASDMNREMRWCQIAGNASMDI